MKEVRKRIDSWAAKAYHYQATSKSMLRNLLHWNFTMFLVMAPNVIGHIGILDIYTQSITPFRSASDLERN